MTSMESQIIAKLNEIVAGTLGLDRVELAPHMTASDVEGWDSVSTIQILVAIEAEFGIRFRTAEMASIENVGGLVSRIVDHLSERSRKAQA